MNDKLIFSIILIFLGTISTFFNDFIIKLQGKSGPGDYSETQRKHMMLIGGIGLLIFGISGLIYTIIKR